MNGSQNTWPLYLKLEQYCWQWKGRGFGIMFLDTSEVLYVIKPFNEGLKSWHEALTNCRVNVLTGMYWIQCGPDRS